LKANKVVHTQEKTSGCSGATNSFRAIKNGKRANRGNVKGGGRSKHKGHTRGRPRTAKRSTRCRKRGKGIQNKSQGKGQHIFHGKTQTARTAVGEEGNPGVWRNNQSPHPLHEKRRDFKAGVHNGKAARGGKLDDNRPSDEIPLAPQKKLKIN